MGSDLTPNILLILLIIVGAALSISEAQLKKRLQPTLSNDEKCRKFSMANKSNNSFASPLYPNNYPANTKCVLTLTAEHGYLIRIDWRNSFAIESSESDDKQKCDNDYLEIRDGPHWYSDVIGKYCGKDFPPMITSKDRYLFLLFTSDDTLEYTGFEAVYTFIKNTQLVRPEIEACYFAKSGAQGFLNHLDVPDTILNYSSTYSVHIDCVWYVEVKTHEKIYLFFDAFELAKANECEINYIEIFWGDPDVWQKKNKFCGSTADPVVTQGNKLYFRYFDVNVRNASKHTKFEAWFTAYRDRITEGDSKNSKENSKCSETEFDCDDATCIDLSLKCNNVTNCRLRYDEEGCNTRNVKKFDITSEHIIIILTLGLGLLAGMFCAACFRCIKKLIKDGKQIQENIRRSREQLEERRSASVSSSHKILNRSHIVDEEAAYVEGKRNGHTRIPTEEDSDAEEEEGEEEEEEEDEEGEEEEDEEEEEEEDVDEEGEESCVEMRDCECQTRDSLVSQRDTPPPPPPPIRRPPDIPPPIGPHLRISPTAPPLPGYNASYFNRHPRKKDPAYSSPPQSSDNYEVSDRSSAPQRPKHKAEAHIQMKERPKYEVKKVPKTAPDVLVTH